MRISRTSPCYFLTSVTKDRLPVFQKDKIKQIVCDAWNEARKSGGIRIFAYGIMPDHTHLISDSARTIAETLRFLNGVAAKRVLDYLKENSFESSLMKLREQTKSRNHKYSLWQHHSNAFTILGEDTMMQKVNYIHQNPVTAGLVELAKDYRFSSSRLWERRPFHDEPFLTDHNDIVWRSAA
ncbi:MAG: hypothetical protein HOP17_03110 [Acidobacteria bacterium]|nr:hypothetical protein [Acidobacteriota bacterium]